MILRREQRALRVDHPGRIYTRDQLMDAMYRDERVVADRTVDSHVKKIRRKLAAVLPEREVLHSVYGFWRQIPKRPGSIHWGSRLVFRPDGTLFVTLGDRRSHDHVQDLASTIGKVVRINPNGTIPGDNPFVGRDGVRPEIWSSGHRNAQAAALDGGGRLWTVEHGAMGGDELNQPQAGRNYGWPVITYGVDYSGAKIGEGTAKAGMEQPVYYWELGPRHRAVGRDVLQRQRVPRVARRPPRGLAPARGPRPPADRRRPRRRGDALGGRARRARARRPPGAGRARVPADRQPARPPHPPRAALSRLGAYSPALRIAAATRSRSAGRR